MQPAFGLTITALRRIAHMCCPLTLRRVLCNLCSSEVWTRGFQPWLHTNITWGDVKPVSAQPPSWTIKRNLSSEAQVSIPLIYLEEPGCRERKWCGSLPVPRDPLYVLILSPTWFITHGDGTAALTLICHPASSCFHPSWDDGGSREQTSLNPDPLGAKPCYLSRGHFLLFF